jgi:CheY-like chemotaxis protein/HPt (histidine-containing phosphotransfer) domain-containing protein
VATWREGVVGANEILIAEDNEANRLLAQKQLERLGYPARAVVDGAEAVAAVAEQPYALVLMDCNMPRLDGFAATRAIRAAEESTGRHTIIVAMTAAAMEDDRAACLAAGMDDYLCKPVMLADLKRVFGRWLSAEGSPEPPAAAPAPPAPSAPVPPPATSDPIDRQTFDRFRSEVGGDEFAAQFVRVFLGELDGRLNGLREGADAGDGEVLRSLAHTLKSTSAMMGAMRLADRCRELEAAGRDGGSAAARSLVEDVRREAEAAREALQSGGFTQRDAVA